jgi:hypothetical protein
MASTTSLALHYGLRLDASPEFIRGYADGMRLDQRGQGVACGRGWIPRSKKCSRDKATATPKEAKARTVEKSKERAKLKGEVKAAKGQKPRVKAPQLSPSKDSNQWWTGIGMKGRMEISEETEGWWQSMNSKERKTVLRAAGVNAKKIGIKGLNQTKPEDAESVLRLGGVNSLRVYVEYAKRKESGEIKAFQKVSPSSKSKAPEKLKEDKPLSTETPRQFAARKIDEAVRIARGEVSPEEYMVSRQWSPETIQAFKDSPDTNDINPGSRMMRYPKKANGTGTIDWSGAESREWAEYQQLRNGDVEQWASNKGLSDYMPSAEIKGRIRKGLKLRRSDSFILGYLAGTQMRPHRVSIKAS